MHVFFFFVWLWPIHLKACPSLPCLILTMHHCFNHRLLKLSLSFNNRYKRILKWAYPLMVEDSCSLFLWCSLRIWLPNGWIANSWVYDSSFSKALNLPIFFVPLGKPLHHLCHSPLWDGFGWGCSPVTGRRAVFSCSCLLMKWLEWLLSKRKKGTKQKFR